MLGAFRKTIQIPYDKNLEYPTPTVSRKYISRYCAEAGWDHTFITDDKVMIDGEEYEIKIKYPAGYFIRLVKTQ